jgi:hypothetical protein
MARQTYTCILCSWYVNQKSLIHHQLSFPHASCFFVLSGAPLLGSTESIRATLSGTTSGLPVTEVSFSESYSIAIILYKMNGTTIPLELVTQLSYR